MSDQGRTTTSFSKLQSMMEQKLLIEKEHGSSSYLETEKESPVNSQSNNSSKECFTEHKCDDSFDSILSAGYFITCY